MENIAETIPIDISKTPGVVENVFIGETVPPRIFERILSYSKSFTTCFLGPTRKFQALTPKLLNMRLELILMLSLFEKSLPGQPSKGSDH
jgi:hypothetical protein